MREYICPTSAQEVNTRTCSAQFEMAEIKALPSACILSEMEFGTCTITCWQAVTRYSCHFGALSRLFFQIVVIVQIQAAYRHEILELGEIQVL